MRPPSDKNAIMDDVEVELRHAVLDRDEQIKKLRAHMAALAGVLAHLLEFADSTGQGCAKQVENARVVLAATPEDVTERGKAVEEVVEAARFIAETAPYLHPEGELRSALAKLDTLGKEEE